MAVRQLPAQHRLHTRLDLILAQRRILDIRKKAEKE
jgi:hypothetical protein